MVIFEVGGGGNSSLSSSFSNFGAFSCLEKEVDIVPPPPFHFHLNHKIVGKNRCFFVAALLLQMENVRNVLKGFNGYGGSVQHAIEEIVTHRYFDMSSVTANTRSLTKQFFGLFFGVRSTSIFLTLEQILIACVVYR